MRARSPFFGAVAGSAGLRLMVIAAALTLADAACGGGGSSPTTPAAPAAPTGSDTLDSTFFPFVINRELHYNDSVVLRMVGNPNRLQFIRFQEFQVEYVENDGIGILNSRETVWIDPDDYTANGRNTNPWVASDHLWSPSYYVFKWGMKVGDGGFTVEKDEEIQVPLGRDGVVTGGCQRQSWTTWKYVHQVQHVEVVARESITVPAGTFDTLKVVVTVDETNNPFNACGSHSVYSQTYWLAQGIGPVQIQPPQSEALLKLVDRPS